MMSLNSYKTFIPLCILGLALLFIPLQVQAACTSPAGPAGNMVYNSDHNVVQWCDGTNWIGLPKPDISQFNYISAGYNHVCGIKSDNTLWCWGYDGFGVLGDDGVSGANKSTPVIVAGGNTWKAVAGGMSHTCGIKSDSTLWCWGHDGYGGLGDDATLADKFTPVTVAGGSTWKTVTAGQYHTCGIKSDNTLWCWGYDSLGQLGDDATIANKATPVIVAGGSTWKAVTAGYAYTCGIKSDNTMWCWGADDYGQIGDDVTLANKSTPVIVAGGSSWKALATGDQHTCGLKSDSTLWCWGSDFNGQLGDDGLIVNKPTPVIVSGGSTWKALATGSSHTCGIKIDGALWCWGNDSSGQLGDDATIAARTTPVIVAGGSTWSSVTASSDESCGTKTDATLWCWGSDNFGELGDDATIASKSTPVIVAGGSTWKGPGTSCTSPSAPAGNIMYNADHKVVQWCDGTNWIGLPRPPLAVSSFTTIDAGTFHSCGIKTDGTLWCWGRDDIGQLGDDATLANKSTPVTVAGGGVWRSVSTGEYSTCGIKSDGTLWCWGLDNSGQLGDDATLADKSTPTQVAGSSSWLAVSAGSQHTCGIKPNNTLWCWGQDMYGQLGDDATLADKYTPVIVAGGATWKAVAAGFQHTCAIKSDNTIWCWGRDDRGQVGDDVTLADKATPVLVAGGYTWKSLAAYSVTCAVRSDDTLWCWGQDATGTLGDDAPLVDKPTPTIVAGGSTWKSASTGRFHTCGIKSDNTLWCWGYDSDGMLGDNATIANQNTPVIVAGGSTWNAGGAGATQTCGIKSDNTIWCWGQDTYGQLGDDATIANKSTPVIVSGGGTWATVQSGTCTSPTGTAGQIIYNADFKMLQWCDGSQWLGVRKPPIDKTVFVTSTTMAGNLGGISGADSICQNRSTASGTLAPAGTYKAWIAAGAGTGPAATFTKIGPLNERLRWKLTNGTVIATTWSDLVDSVLAASIDRDEFGALQSAAGNVWSNVDGAGAPADVAVHCSTWSTSTGGGNRGRAGSSSAIDSNWTNNTNPQCNGLLRLYCFQQ